MSDAPGTGPDTGRRAGELSPRELLRWVWRQLTSMRTALILLLLLALAAVPGSVIPQEGVDSLKATQWKDAHPDLTPVYEKLGLFAVYSSPWFAAIFVLLMVSLVGCIIPRTLVYFRAARAAPPRAPRNLTRLPDHASYRTDDDIDVVLARARTVLKGRRYRVRPADEGDAAVSSERGYLREVGNLVFHLSVVVVLVGFAVGGLFGYKGGVILVVGQQFSNSLTQYDDFVPGRLFDEKSMEPFCFTVDTFDVEWLVDGPRRGMSRGFSADTRYREDCTTSDGDEVDYDLRVNHPLGIGGTDVFLIGHGYAPQITVRDGEGKVAYSGPTIFLPQDQSLFSFGVVKANGAKPQQIGLEGVFFPTFFLNEQGDPVNLMGELNNPLLSLSVFTGDLGLGDGAPQSVYVLDKSATKQVTNPDGTPLRLDLQEGETATLPNNLGTVTFDGIQQWNRLQISKTPGKLVTLGGVVLALLGLLGSLFVRPRRVWVRARVVDGETLVEVAALDRSGGGDVRPEIDEVVAALRGGPVVPTGKEQP